MLIDGRVLTEVAGILFYLARRFPAAGLLPDGDIEAEARVVSWMSFIASSIHPARRQGLEHARAIYALADKRLGKNDWAVGDRYSIADIHLFRLYWRFRNSLNPAPGDFPNIEAHYTRMMARPAVKKTIEVEFEDRLRAAGVAASASSGLSVVLSAAKDLIAACHGMRSFAALRMTVVT